MKVRKVFSITAIFLAGVIIGGVAGAYGVAHYTSLFLSGDVESRAAVAIKQNIWVLKRLREGKVEQALELLEIDLDGNLITFSADMPIAKQWQESVGRSLVFAKEYRSQYPRSTQNHEIDATVASVLSKVEAK